MIFKVLKKLHLNGAARAALLPGAALLSRGSLSMSAEEAQMLLGAHSPDSGGSAFWEQTKETAGPEYDLDIIVPVYNVEKYLPACIESILCQQTAYRFRVICVDDGSTDNSGNLLDAYGEDPRMLVIHQENRGFSGARNRGLEYVRSQYLMFVDSDDRLPPGAIDAMLSEAFKQDAVLVQGCFSTFFGEETPKRELTMGQHVLLNPPNEKLPGYAWSKAIRTEYFRNLRFPEGYWFEDSISAQILYPLIRRDTAALVGIDDVVYHYRQNPNGISRKALKKKKSLDSFWITRSLQKDRRLFGLETDQENYEYILDNIYLTYIRNQYQPKDVRQALLILWSQFLTEQFPDYHTQRKAYEPLETAVRTQNYTQYSLCCRLL